MPETATALPPTEEQLEQEETKYTLRRNEALAKTLRAVGPGLCRKLPDAGTRRFSRLYMMQAIDTDRSYDGIPAQDQGPWDSNRDVFDEETWWGWAR